MRKYELVFILDPDLNDQARTDMFDKVKNIISNEKGILLDFDEWGNKKLAYEIKKKLRGHYVCLTFGGTGDLVKEIERNLRLSDDILKFMTILLSDDVTAQQLEEEAEAIRNRVPEESAEETATEDDASPQDTDEKSDTPEMETETEEKTE